MEERGEARGGGEARRGVARRGEGGGGFLLLCPAVHAMLTMDTVEKCVCRAIPAARGRARSILSVWK